MFEPKQIIETATVSVLSTHPRCSQIVKDFWRVGGAVVRFDGYKPREDGSPEGTSGPKIAHFDRVEWHAIPDPATAAAALRAGEMDWWAYPSPAFLPLLRQ